MYVNVCLNGSVVALDWYRPCTFFRSGVSGAGVLMHALCLDWYRGCRFNVRSATYLVLLDVVGRNLKFYPMSNLSGRWSGSSTPVSAALPPGKRTGTHVYRRLGGWTPKRKAHSKSLYRQRCSGLSMSMYYAKFYNGCLLLQPSSSLFPVITLFDTLHSQLQANIFHLSTCESVLKVTRCYTNAPPILRP